MEGSPYRERPRLFMCPRCRELLDVALDGVRTCMRCEGLWLSPTTFTVAFGNPRGPVGTSAWWRNAIECPECAIEGRTTMLQARMCGEVLVDTCQEHGLWLDRGELAQLLGTAHDELARLRAQGLPVPDLADLDERREKWRADGELRKRTTAEYQRLLEEEHRRREAIREQERLDAERAAAAAAVRPPVTETRPEPRVLVSETSTPPPPAPADAEVQARLLGMIEQAPDEPPDDGLTARERERAERERHLAEELARAEEARQRAAAREEAARTAERVAAWNRERREAARRQREESESRVEQGTSALRRKREMEHVARSRQEAEEVAQLRETAEREAVARERRNRTNALLRAISELESSRESAEHRLRYLAVEQERVQSKLVELTEQIVAAKAELAQVKR